MVQRSIPSKKPVQKTARPIPTADEPDAAPVKKKPPRPVKKQDAADVDRAESEGMAQPQGVRVKEKLRRADVQPSVTKASSSARALPRKGIAKKAAGSRSRPKL